MNWPSERDGAAAFAEMIADILEMQRSFADKHPVWRLGCVVDKPQFAVDDVRVIDEDEGLWFVMN